MENSIDKILAGILKFINSNGRDGLDIYDARERLLTWRDKAVTEMQLDDRLVMLGWMEANQANLSVGEIIATVKGQAGTIEAELNGAKDESA